MKAQIPIIQHADVKRMLLFQRAVSEGALSLILFLAKLTDLSRVSQGEGKEKYELMLDLLTPVAKTYPSEMGILSVSQAIQCLGGYGYCQDFSLEQHFRDMRIHPIHEGTTGIQGMDLLGRKVIMKNGKAFSLFAEEISRTAAEAKKEARLAPFAESLLSYLKLLQDITGYLASFALKGQIDRFLADATLYLELFGLVAIAWQWLVQAVVCAGKAGNAAAPAEKDFYEGKIRVCEYFFRYELPKADGILKILKESEGMTAQVSSELLEG